MELDARLEGWLFVSAGLESGFGPSTLTWHKRYCVLEPTLKKFYILKDEQSAQAVSNSAVVRLDEECTQECCPKEEVFQKPLDEVFDAGTRLTQIQLNRISKRIKSSGVRLSTRNSSFSSDSPVTEKAGAILGINRAQPNNGCEPKSEHHNVSEPNPINPMVWTVYLGSDSPPLIRVVHPSLSGREHCFCVETSKRSVYLACRSDLELNRWIDSLQHVIDPLKEERVQYDQSLTVWIVEAKHLPKKRFFAELFLDGLFCCRTVTKPVTEMLFWGEHFKFWDLRTFHKIRVVLRRENKNKKASVVGETEISVGDISLGTEHEHWYNLGSNHGQKPSSGSSGAGGKDPQIRLKVKLQILTMLPLNCYEALLTYLTSSSVSLCKVMESYLNVRQKEELANLLLHVLHDFQKARNFLEEIVMLDVEKTEDASLLFRGNSIATKAIDLYMKLIGTRYLKNTLTLFIRDVYYNAQDFEVDTTRIAAGEDYTTNQQNMRMKVDKAWALILSSYPKFPLDLRELFSRIRVRCEETGRGEISRNLLSGSIFLRFFCPAIMSPSLFNLAEEYPDERVSRCLIITAKVIQNLANFTKFGGKEEYMSFMNDFVETAIPNMDLFLSKISEPVEEEFRSAEIYNSNIGHSLSSLHTFFSEKIDTLSEADREELGVLPKILLELDDLCENIPRHSAFLPAQDTALDRRRKTGSLPTININETQRHDLKVRSYSSCREKSSSAEGGGYPNIAATTGGGGGGTPPKLPVRTPPEGETESKDSGSDENSRRRSLPVVPEETITSIPGGRQMSDPTCYTGSPGAAHRSSPTPLQRQSAASQPHGTAGGGGLNGAAAVEQLTVLRAAISTFLHTHTGRRPDSDEEIIETLAALSTALNKK